MKFSYETNVKDKLDPKKAILNVAFWRFSEESPN